ncbi:MAG TPA: elongation factor Ts [Candidatus Paceibacterota bacterium]
MADVSMEQIKALRDKTGISVMQCKKALEEAGGDEEKALVLLRKKGAEIAAKKSDREFGAGAVAAYIHSNGMVGAMIELVSETDFVSNNAEFKTLAYDIAMHISATNPEFTRKDEIKEEDKAKAIEVFQAEVEGKPENLKEQILAGKLDAYFKERILLEQPFIKNPDLTIQQLLDNAIQKFGERIEVARFTRMKIGK